MAYDDSYVKGSEGVIEEIKIYDLQGQGKTGLTHLNVTAYYTRPGGVATAIALVAGSPGDPYSEGKFIEMDNVNAKGAYQIHLPNACFAAGANFFKVYFQTADSTGATLRIGLTGTDSRNANNMGMAFIPGTLATADVVIGIIGGKCVTSEDGKQVQLYTRAGALYVTLDLTVGPGNTNVWTPTFA